MKILRTLIISGTLLSSCMTTDDTLDKNQLEQSISSVKDSIQNKVDKLKCLAEIEDEPKPYLDLAIQLNSLVTAYLHSIDHSETKDILTNLDKKYHLIFDSTIKQRTPKLFLNSDINAIDSIKFLKSDTQSEMTPKTKSAMTLSVLRTHNFVLNFFSIKYSHDPCAGQKASR